jgi:dTDP-4-amino-4,6-dideoxygalactose transaminase
VRELQVSPMNVPFFRYTHILAPQKEEILRAATGVMEKGAFILQTELETFESEVAKFAGSRHAIGVADGTESMILALLAAGISPGDEVILASHTYIATAAAVHFVGAKVVLAECRKDRLIDPDDIRAKITSRTRALMPTQLNGRTCDMNKMNSICREHDLILIEDAAQALGSKWRGKCAGTFGFAGSISLYPAKVLGCFGDGGLLFTQDDKTAETLRELRDHGRNRDGLVVRWGLNSRLDNLQAAILSVKLKIFPQEVERRRAIARIYHERLKELEDLVLPPGPDEDPDHFDIYQNYEIESGNREKLREYLKAKGIGTIIQWAGKAVHQFQGLGFEGVRLPFTDAFMKRCFLLPMNTSLSDEEVHYICDQVSSFYGSRN